LNGRIEIGTGSDPETLEIGNLVVLHEARRNYTAQLPEGVSSDAQIRVPLDNSFAPQANGGYISATIGYSP